MHRRNDSKEEWNDLDLDMEGNGRNGHNDHNGHRGRMTAFLIGSMAGGIAAFLLAPTSGRRLRRSLNRSGRRWKRRASHSVATLRDRGEQVMDRTSESLQALAEDAKKTARHWAAHS